MSRLNMQLQEVKQNYERINSFKKAFRDITIKDEVLDIWSKIYSFLLENLALID